MSAHALLSPSSASRWLSCPPSARMEETFPETSGEAAREGTLAHAVGELILQRHYKIITIEEFNTKIELLQQDDLYSEDLYDYAQDYASYVVNLYESARKHTKDAILQIEAKLNLTDYVPDGFGTGDAVIIADECLDIIDLKYGKGVSVSCDNNKQIMLYALGALREFDHMYDIRHVRMTIYQPRMQNISSFSMPVKDLVNWAETELRVKANQAFQGTGEFSPGEHCRFCKAKPLCKAHAEEQLKLAVYEFRDGYLLADAEVSDILTRAASFKAWLTSVEEYALLSALNDGKKWPGYKLVEGKSNRCYSDPEKVALKLVSAGYKEELLYEKKLLGITAMEKAITKKTFEALLSPLIIKPSGKPTLVPQTDKRPEWNSAKNDFSDSIEQ